MQIRKAVPTDKTAIIELLKKSLGESTIPKSESLWSWKHEQNPFGPSYVMVAEENNAVIGIRAFMQWNWQWNGKIYKAIRAVDTATHPDHQGKGIFKKLTLEQAEKCKQQGVDFIFNTPNLQSKPGYLKMGWVEQGRMPLKFKVIRPLSLTFSMFFNKKKYQDYNGDPSPDQAWAMKDFDFLGKAGQNTQLITTQISSAYISWRYANNPLFRYNFFTDKKNYVLISRVKKQSFKSELRLVDFFLLNPSASKKTVRVNVREQILEFCKMQAIDIISFSGPQFNTYRPFFNWMGIIPVKALGPIVTLKDLNMNGEFSSLLEVNNWGYSLGDLELF